MIYGLDIETDDPLLKTQGESWVFNKGRILVADLYDYAKKTDHLAEKTQDYKYIVDKILCNPAHTVIGANLSYDIGWLFAVTHTDTDKLACKVVDVQLAEAMIDPFAKFSLDDLAHRYLNEQKGFTVLKDICTRLGLRGDYRAHLGKLWDAGYIAEIEEYVKSDSYQPCLIWEKQKEILQRRKLMTAFEVYTENLIVAIQMKQHGIRFNYEQWQKSCEIIEKAYVEAERDFKNKYGELNYNSPRQVGSLFENAQVPLSYKITVRGYIPQFGAWRATNNSFAEKDKMNVVDELNANSKSAVFKLYKGKILAQVPRKALAKPIVDFCTSKGWDVIVSPIVGQSQIAALKEYQIVKDFVQLKTLITARSLFFGDNFGRFIVKDEHGDYRVHPSFLPVGARTTGRYSSKNPNCQNISSKIKVFEGTENELDIAYMERSLFLPEHDCMYLKLDFSGQENRMQAHFAIGDDGEFIREKYREDPLFDEHSFVVAQSGLDKTYDAKTARKYAKNVRFGSAYGAGYKKLMVMFNWTEDFAKELQQKIFEASPWFVETRNAIQKQLQQKRINGVKTILRFIPCHDTNTAYRFYNYLIQGSSADQLKLAVRDLRQYIIKNNLQNKLRLILTVHDEFGVSIDKNELHRINDIKDIMQNAFSPEMGCDIPFIADPELGRSFGEVKADYEDNLEELEETLL